MLIAFYPLNEFSGLHDFKEKFWVPLFDAFQILKEESR